MKLNYSYDKITNYIERMKDLKVLIIGEQIFDEYQYGFALGKAGKAPIVAFQNDRLERYEGGVLAIKNHLNSFCDVRFYSGGVSITKKRYIQNGQKLFETYSKDMDDYWYLQNRVEDDIDNIKKYDLVIVSDFGHGLLTRELRNKIIKKAKFLALNCQRNAGNMGMNSINKYDKADYICIDQYELRLATSNQYEPIEDVIDDTFTKKITAAITLSKDGCIIYKNGKLVRIPSLINKALDTIGAGDSFLAITSPLAYLDVPADIIGFVGNCAGAMACGYPGNKEYTTKKKLYKYLRNVIE